MKSDKSLWNYYPGQIPADLIPAGSQEDKGEESLEKFLLVMAGALVFFLVFFVAAGYIEALI